MKARLSLLSAALLLGLTATGVQAAFQSCVGTGYDISTKVTTATNCTILLPLNGNINDKLNPTVLVNDEKFFGYDDWQFDGKWDNLNVGGIDTSVLFNFTGNAQSGTYTFIGQTGGSFTDIMFVLKDGAKTNLVGYLVPAGNGDYSSPFVQPPFPISPATGPKNISHISVYFRGSTTSGGGATSGNGVPEPGVLGLLGLGLLALGALRRRAV